ncbi:MAG TPA: PEP-CTERM sorting domain-containing protein [Bryobacteraceae bacterium]|nr:PEP-CTERM sorting domain-containing protein [Bryobacteraceae bacterium]
MKNILKSVKPVWCLCLLLLASSAFADTGDVGDISPIDMPSYQLSGWFFNPTADPFPIFSDPSLEWTTDDNVALINHWLTVVADMANDPSAGNLSSNSDPLAVTGSQPPSEVPEPATLSLFSMGLALLGFAAFRRARRPVLEGISGKRQGR